VALQHRRSALVLAAVLIAGCGVTAGGDRTERGRQADQRYALLRAERWKFNEAIDLADGDPLASIDRPPVDWYAEYERSSASRSEMVRLSGHRASLDEHRAELEKVGFELSDVDVEGRRAIGGSDRDDAASPAVLLLEQGGRSLLLLSYDLSLEELARLSEHLEPADRAAWLAAGGVIRR